MALRRADGSDPVHPAPIERLDGVREERRARTSLVARGTLACPACDAPVTPAGASAPAGALACRYCDHAAPVRDFLTLTGPPRAARVVVRAVRGRTKRAAAAQRPPIRGTTTTSGR